MSAHKNPENKSDSKLSPVSTPNKKDRQDALDMARAEGEGFNKPAQLESLEEAEAREHAAKIKQQLGNKNTP